jgi:hypothetical protein
LIDELQLQQELNILRANTAAPMSRARAFVRFARRVEVRQAHLVCLSMAFYGVGNGAMGTLFFDNARRLSRLCQEARQRARILLGQKPIGYGYEPRRLAYPSWKCSDTVIDEGRKVIV